MSIDVSPEIGTRLIDAARRQGVSLETLLERLIAVARAGEERGGVVAAEADRVIPELPVLHLGVMGPLHRRDIYDDAR